MIRHATADDMPSLRGIYAAARDFMRRNGNPTQWADTYPPEEDLLKDIAAGELYVCHEGNDIYGVFKLMFSPEPSYANPVEGKWINDDPYGTIHRIASLGTHGGVFDECMAYAKAKIDNLRIDTHPNNYPMQHLCERSGFRRCGMIIISDGSPRIMYQWIRGLTE